MAERSKAIYKAGWENYTEHTWVLFNCSIAEPFAVAAVIFFHFDQHCVVWRTWPLLKAYRIWDVLPSLRNRYGESIRALQDCDRITPTPAALMSKRMALWQWVLLTLPRSYPGQITLTVEWHKRSLTLWWHWEHGDWRRLFIKTLNILNWCMFNFF